MNSTRISRFKTNDRNQFEVLAKLQLRKHFNLRSEGCESLLFVKYACTSIDWFNFRLGSFQSGINGVLL